MAMFPTWLISTPTFRRRWYERIPDDHHPDGGAEARLWGMWLFIASLGMLFGASLALYFISRATVPGFLGKLPHAPAWLYAGTAVLVISSITMQHAVTCVRRGWLDGLRNAMFVTLALGGVFLASQFAAWVHYTRLDIDATANLATFSVYLLTVLHALHVMGGLVGLTWVSLRAHRRWYSPARSAGVRACALYWHFLGVVWLILFAALFLV